MISENWNFFNLYRIFEMKQLFIQFGLKIISLFLDHAYQMIKNKLEESRRLKTQASMKTLN